MSTASGRQRRCTIEEQPIAPGLALLSRLANSDASSSEFGEALAEAAQEQLGEFVVYTDSYKRLSFPMGDIPSLFGVCTDVIVRAFRKASVDLQKDIHEDMAKSFSAYPTRWGLSKTDTNIDHRRVPNLQTYFTRQGKSLATGVAADKFLPGDIVTWDLGTGVDHVGIVVNVWSQPTQRYLIVHNIGAGAHMEDVLFAWKITGHYRYF